jgi:hypothetical protein
MTKSRIRLTSLSPQRRDVEGGHENKLPLIMTQRMSIFLKVLPLGGYKINLKLSKFLTCVNPKDKAARKRFGLTETGLRVWRRRDSD